MAEAGRGVQVHDAMSVKVAKNPLLGLDGGNSTLVIKHDY